MKRMALVVSLLGIIIFLGYGRVCAQEAAADEADLEITRISINDQSLANNPQMDMGRYTLCVMARNLGPSTNARRMRIRVLRDGREIASSISQTGANSDPASAGFGLTREIDFASGACTLEAIIESEDGSVDQNRANNRMTGRVTFNEAAVAHAPAPDEADLEVYDFKIAGQVVTGNLQMRPGRYEVSVMARNLGPSTNARRTRIRVLRDGREIMSSISQTGANSNPAANGFGLTREIDFSAGTFTLEAVVAPEDGSVDPNRANDRISGRVTFSLPRLEQPILIQTNAAKAPTSLGKDIRKK